MISQQETNEAIDQVDELLAQTTLDDSTRPRLKNVRGVLLSILIQQRQGEAAGLCPVCGSRSPERKGKRAT